MKSVLDNPKAFAPFFDDKVSFDGRRGDRILRVVCRACVICAGLVDVDSDAVVDSVEYAYSVKVIREDWPDVDPPQRGDVLSLDDGTSMRVTSVVSDVDWFEINAKTKGGAA